MGDERKQARQDWIPEKNPQAATDNALLLDPSAERLLSGLDGNRSVSDLSMETGLSENNVTTILEELVKQGVVLPDPERTDHQIENEAQSDTSKEYNVATHRKLFESELRKLERDVRVRLAGRASDPVLSALCFDPDPAVINGVLSNHSLGSQQARLIAEHHHTAAGLEALSRKSQLMRDQTVFRFLLRNLQTPDSVFRRMFSPLPLVQIFKSTLGRECTQRAKRIAREVLRQKFQRGEGEAKAALIFKTEGRCLNQLLGIPIDQKTTMLLCRRTYNSVILIQNLARFPATPPKLITHLLKQPAVRRQQHLKRLLKRHPNCPASAKR